MRTTYFNHINILKLEGSLHDLLSLISRCCGIVDTTGQRLNGKWLVMDASYAAPSMISSPLNDRYGGTNSCLYFKSCSTQIALCEIDHARKVDTIFFNRRISRAILVTDRSLSPDSQQHVSDLYLFPRNVEIDQKNKTAQRLPSN